MVLPRGLPDVAVKSRGRRRIESRHPWVFADDVVRSGAAHGDLVRVVDAAGQFLGVAFFSARSKITLRMVDHEDIVPDRTFWARRVEQALARRASPIDRWEARRIVFGEADGIPGLVADLYGTHLVVQTATWGAERILEAPLAALRERLTIDSVLIRNDASVRALEGLPREVKQHAGTTPEEIVVAEGAIRYAVDPWKGQKTGAFLDQRENREAAAAYASGRVLDAFAYHASFGLHAGKAASEVVVLDGSADAIARARANAARNGFTNFSFLEANAFETLRAMERRGERFDCVLLDPPAFAKSRKDVPAAVRGYREINLRAVRLLSPGGVLVTSSCSFNLDETAFRDLLAEAAGSAGRDLTVCERRGQASDHPVLIGFPEGRYLKCFILREAAGLS